jgi:hypothetical protein
MMYSTLDLFDGSLSKGSKNKSKASSCVQERWLLMGRMDEVEERGRWWRWRWRCRQEVPGAQSDKRRGANPFKAALESTQHNAIAGRQIKFSRRSWKVAKDARGDYYRLFCPVVWTSRVSGWVVTKSAVAVACTLVVIGEELGLFVPDRRMGQTAARSRGR